MTTEPKKLLLLGMASAMTFADVEKLKRDIASDLPDHEIRVIPGLMFALELDKPVSTKREKPSGAYL